METDVDRTIFVPGLLPLLVVVAVGAATAAADAATVVVTIAARGLLPPPVVVVDGVTTDLDVVAVATVVIAVDVDTRLPPYAIAYMTRD